MITITLHLRLNCSQNAVIRRKSITQNSICHWSNGSDEAFEGLIDYFSKVDEKTIVVMFGDHQPTDIIAEPILEANGKLDDDSLQTQQERYIVPFVIWANYDIEKQD